MLVVHRATLWSQEFVETDFLLVYALLTLCCVS